MSKARVTGPKAATDAIQKVHRKGPVAPALLDRRKPTDAAPLGEDVAAMQRIHKRAPWRLEPETIVNNAKAPDGNGSRSVRAIRKAISPGERQVDMVELQDNLLMRRHGLRKFVMPSESANGDDEGPYANTGASNNWKDQTDAQPKPERLGGFTDTAISPNDRRIAAAVATVDDEDPTIKALKAIFARSATGGSK